MPDFCVQVGTSLPQNGNRSRSRRAGSAPDEHPCRAAATPPAAAAPEKSLPPIAGSRAQRKKARAVRFPRIVVADTVTDYRRVVPLLVEPTDVVLEVGCCSGATTSVLFDHCACAVGAWRHCLAVPVWFARAAQLSRERRPLMAVCRR